MCVGVYADYHDAIVTFDLSYIYCRKPIPKLKNAATHLKIIRPLNLRSWDKDEVFP